MDYRKYLKGFSGFNTTKLALWGAVFVMVLVAGMAALGQGPH